AGRPRRQTHSDKFIKVHKRANKEKLGLNKDVQTQQQHQAIFQKDSVLCGGLILGGHLFFKKLPKLNAADQILRGCKSCVVISSSSSSPSAAATKRS
uniref:Uncharacterized protein n=1 Tax=Anas zonorhyncha TaxID=75864 RepID=A0A8B9U2L5_9AVES